MKKDLIIAVVFLIGMSFLINSGSADENPRYEIQYVRLAGQNIKVDLASTPAEQAQGLSWRSGLEEYDGMLFIFSTRGGFIFGRYQSPRFWMKDMNFPIDIIWIGEDGEIIYIKKDAQPKLYPETYGPDPYSKNAKYVLEVVSGFSDKNNLKPGDKVEFVY